MVRSTGTKLSKPQIMGCIRSIDADGDGTIDIPELHAAMEVYYSVCMSTSFISVFLHTSVCMYIHIHVCIGY